MAIENVNYSECKYDLQERAESRMLSQFYNSKVLKLLLNAFTSEVQELSDAIYELIRQRNINFASGSTLDAIGRIVGRDRTQYNYTSAFWFAPDAEEVQPDNGNWWTQHAEQATSEAMDDTTYRQWLWLKILENHNKFSSVPELEGAVLDGIGETIGIQRTGMMEAEILTQPTISLTNKALLTYNKDTELTDNEYLFAYPATTSITEE